MRPVSMSLIFSLVVVVSGCQSAAITPPKVPADAMGMAQTLIEAKNYDQALAVLHHFGAEPLSLEDKSRWYLLGGTALYRSGEPWDAFELFQDFIREHSIPVPALADQPAPCLVGDVFVLLNEFIQMRATLTTASCIETSTTWPFPVA